MSSPADVEPQDDASAPKGAGQTDHRVAPGAWHDTIAGLRAEGYAFFDWLSAVDETDAEPPADAAEEGEQDALSGPGLEVVCHLMDVRRPLRRALVRTRVPEGGSLASVTDLFAGAAWHERETHEMFGIGFDGFDDGSGEGLRPLLLPDGFEGTPLLKSFHLAARASKPWPGAKEPGEGEGSTTKRAPSRRRMLPPGVPPETWGPRGD